MLYRNFLKRIVIEINSTRQRAAGDLGASPTQISEATVREILDAFPSGFSEMREGDRVKTPVGTFKMTRQKARSIHLPNSTKRAQVEEKLIVRLNPSGRLQFPVPPE